MESNQASFALGEWLRKILQSGLPIDAHVETYMASTFGTTDLDAILAAADSSEIDSLMELLFYPDTNFQIRFEKRWGRVRFGPDAPPRVSACLAHPPVEAALYFPTQAGPVILQVPADVLIGFVQRLNITWQPPAVIDERLERSVPGDNAPEVRVRLRNARVRWTAERTGLLCLYLEKMPAAHPEFFAGLDLLLNMLWAVGPGADPYDFLIGQKQTRFQALCKAEDFERRRLAANMEILMLQGERAAYGDMDLIKRQMRLIDSICNALFGRTEYFAQPAEDRIQVDSRRRENVMDLVLKTLM